MLILQPWLIAVVAILLAAAPASATSAITVLLKPESSVTGPELFLGDVAEMQGTDDTLLAQLARKRLGEAPASGAVRILTGSQIRSLLLPGLPTGVQVVVTGAPESRVRLQARQVRWEDIAPELKAHIASVTPWKEAEIEIRSARDTNDVELPPGDVAFRIPRRTAPPSYRNALIPVEAVLDGKSIRTFWARVDVGINATVLQAARKVSRGAALVAEDLKQVQVEIQDPRAAHVRTVDEAMGRISLRALSPGDPIMQERLAAPDLVRNGDTVRLRLARGMVRIAVMAQALQNGKLGDSIRVRNVDFKRTLLAQVTGQGEVSIQ